MTTRETPPAPGLTRENTGVLHGVYAGWYVTPEEQRNIERRASKRLHERHELPPMQHPARVASAPLGTPTRRARKGRAA